MKYSFETMSLDHQKDVMEIFNYYIENTFYAYPERKIPEMFYSKFLEIGKTYPAFVVKCDDSVIGFCLLRPYNPFPVFRETAEVSYFIKSEFTGKGIGSIVLKKLEESALDMGIKRLLADISSENRHSINFHLKNGFSECGLLKNAGKKFDKYFNVVWMEKEL